MTGVSPVTMDDLTSGFNIATNISQDEDFNAMLGFSEEESVFNSDMVLYHLKALVAKGKPPDSMQDLSVYKMYAKIFLRADAVMI